MGLSLGSIFKIEMYYISEKEWEQKGNRNGVQAHIIQQLSTIVCGK